MLTNELLCYSFIKDLLQKLNFWLYSEQKIKKLRGFFKNFQIPAIQ